MSDKKVFVSSNRRDSAVAEKNAQSLRKLGTGRTVTTFHDRDTAPGTDFREAIKKRNLRSSDAVLVVTTSPELASYGWIGYEIGMAEALHKPVMLATTDRHSLSEFPQDFASVRSFDFDPDNLESAARLLSDPVKE